MDYRQAASAALSTSSVPRVTGREVGVLALISLTTVIVMSMAAELGARIWWPEQEKNECYTRGHLASFRPRAGCVARTKNPEGPWTTMTYNDCGYRSARPCGPKPKGVRRVVVLGSSLAEGWYVRYEDHFASRVETALAQSCGFPVEFQNLASLARPQNLQDTLLDEVAGLKPDAVILVFAPYDLLSFSGKTDGDSTEQAAAAPLRRTPTDKGLLSSLRLMSRESRALIIAQHYMLENENLLYRAYQLSEGDDALHVPLSAAYVERYANFERLLAKLASRLRSEDIPLVVVPAPNRIQAALISNHVSLPNVDAWAFAQAVKTIGERNRVLVADAFAVFANSSHAERLYYAVDGHMTGGANALLAIAIKQSLVDGSVKAFARCRR